MVSSSKEATAFAGCLPRGEAEAARSVHQDQTEEVPFQTSGWSERSQIQPAIKAQRDLAN